VPGKQSKQILLRTGTSIFPGARNTYGDPIYVDDVAVDFPNLKILLAHGGRPLWMRTAFFLLRRHANVFLDISGIPPKLLLNYFPRLEEIAHKTLFGTDWPGPGVPEIKTNLDDFRALPLREETQREILSRTALKIWPA
jgi:predicted TIM-barrel fold metal-dependent hydrolase